MGTQAGRLGGEEKAETEGSGEYGREGHESLAAALGILVGTEKLGKFRVTF